jgi:hypothetical protein
MTPSDRPTQMSTDGFATRVFMTFENASGGTLSKRLNELPSYPLANLPTALIC